MAKKENNRKSGAQRRHKERLREEAIQRQNRYDNLSLKEKLIQINSRPGESKKERNRLLKK